jgi:hypothetical protein
MFWLSDAYEPTIKNAFFFQKVGPYTLTSQIGFLGATIYWNAVVSFYHDRTSLACFLYLKEFLPCSIHSNETVTVFLSNN